MIPHVAPVRPSLATADRPSWRVSDPSGDVIGYVDQIRCVDQTGHDDAVRYRARALVSRLPLFHELGEFWRFDDAVDCFAR